MKAVSLASGTPERGASHPAKNLLRDLELIQLEGRPGGAVAGVPRRIGGAVEGGQGHLAHDLVVRVARDPLGAEPYKDVGAHPPDQFDGALHQLLPGHVRQLPVEEPEEVDLGDPEDLRRRHQLPGAHLPEMFPVGHRGIADHPGLPPGRRRQVHLRPRTGIPRDRPAGAERLVVGVGQQEQDPFPHDLPLSSATPMILHAPGKVPHLQKQRAPRMRRPPPPAGEVGPITPWRILHSFRPKRCRATSCTRPRRAPRGPAPSSRLPARREAP